MLGYIVSFGVLISAASAGVLLGGLGEGLGVGVGVVGGGHHVVDVQTPPKYEFKYGVEDPKTGDRKQQSEVRVNDVVRGEYSLAEPDGTIRVVKYTADDHNGYNAIVSRVGHAAHPQALLRKAVVPVAHSLALPVAHSVAVPVAHSLALPVAHSVAVASHGIALGGGIGLGGGLLDGREGILGGRGDIWGRERIDDGLLGRGGIEGGILGHGGLLGHGGIGLGGI